MRTRIFTLLVAFLAIAGNAVWGQDSVSGDSWECGLGARNHKAF